jgi:hypothetical protein
VFVYLSAAPRDWWGGDSYGPRRLATLVPVAAVGIAGLLRRLRPGWRAVLSGALVLWAVINVSAYMSGFDDLWVLLRGTPGLFNPQPASIYEGVHWIDPWGPFHALKPGFTFTDKPHNADRLLGALTCAALLGLVTWCWNRLRGSAGAQRTVLACVAAWVILCAAWLAVVVPINDDWNRRWKAVVHGEAEPPGTRPFPTGVADAALLLRAVHSLKAGDETAFREGWSRLRTRGAFGIDEEDVRALARPGGTNER